MNDVQTGCARLGLRNPVAFTRTKLPPIQVTARSLTRSLGEKVECAALDMEAQKA